VNYRDVYVIGVGMTKIYKKAPVSADELGRQAIHAAVKDAGIAPKEIQSIYIGEMGGLSGSVCFGQRVCGTLGLGLQKNRDDRLSALPKKIPPLPTFVIMTSYLDMMLV